MAMQDLIKLVAARWRGASPLHIASFLLERPDQCGLQRDDDKMRTAKALYLQWGELGCWACAYTIAAGLSHFGADPINGRPLSVDKHVHITRLNKDATTDDVWRVIADHYGLRKVPKVAAQQSALMAARCYVDFQNRTPPSPKLTYDQAAKLYSIDFEGTGGLGNFQRATRFLRVVDERCEQRPTEDRRWIEHFLRPIWNGDVGMDAALQYTISILDITSADTIPLPSSEATIVAPHPSMEPDAIPSGETKTTHFDPYDMLRELAANADIHVGDIISDTSQFMVLESQRSRSEFLHGLRTLITDLS